MTRGAVRELECLGGASASKPAPTPARPESMTKVADEFTVAAPVFPQRVVERWVHDGYVRSRIGACPLAEAKFRSWYTPSARRLQ